MLLVHRLFSFGPILPEGDLYLISIKHVLVVLVHIRKGFGEFIEISDFCFEEVIFIVDVKDQLEDLNRLNLVDVGEIFLEMRFEARHHGGDRHLNFIAFLFTNVKD
jgi:hypothetical protein